MPPKLPIDDVLDDIRSALDGGRSAVVVAPPGAGKTTRIPLALADERWLAGRKILVLEPRRLAARGAAQQMARLLGERMGETVGLRARLGTVVGPRTRIEVITEGVFIRMILNDPTLEDVGAVLFDEFHERSLDADLGLALALDARQGLREDLRIVAMSATLDAAKVADLLGGAPVIESEGRMFPVETRYAGRSQDARIEDWMAAAVERALATEAGSILAFLPGQAEIRRVAERLGDHMREPDTEVVALHAGLDLAMQDKAVAPAPPGQRKVVLATSIAETSLTIEGVRIVIDSGLQRSPRYDAGAGTTRLVTERASRAAVDQRRGRAGRTEPGVCIRLWDEPHTRSLPAFAAPEITVADLAPLLLNAAAWGVTDPTQLAWLDPPPAARLDAARQELLALGALASDGRLTELGRDIGQLGLPPRLAAMVLKGAQAGAAGLAAEIAALITERGIGGSETDIAVRLAKFRGDRTRRASQLRSLAKGWTEVAEAMAREQASAAKRTGHKPGLAQLLALAFPDRIAKSRGSGGQFLLASGRGAFLPDSDPLSRAAFLVAAELSGSAQQSRITLAALMEEADVLCTAGDRLEESVETQFDEIAGALRTRRQRRIGAIVLGSEPLPVPADDNSAAILADAAVRRGIARLAWSRQLQQLRARIAFLATSEPGDWPDLSDAALAKSAQAWLAPFLGGKAALAEITAETLAQALDVLVPYEMARRIDKAAPTHFEAPTGNRHPIDYSGPLAPSVTIRVQELFGLISHPTIGGGRSPLTLELVSPAGRPIQITRDLPGFWSGSWADVRAQMRGRYPKHPWPEKPQDALPTARAKPRGT